MDRSETIKLISQSFTQDAIGQYVPVETSKEVFCSVRSITRAEWFDAGRSGMKPQISFVLFAFDYDGEKIIEYDNKRYAVYRTYFSKTDSLELYCEEKGGTDESESNESQS